MKKISAGILLYRLRPEGLQVFLVHPGGPFWKKKDHGAWSIPKGECLGSEALLADAKREFKEETGVDVDGSFRLLTPVKQPGGKVVHAWAVEGDLDSTQLKSNTFLLEWPPRSGRQQAFPEIDRGEWFGLAEARTKLLVGQRPLLDELERLVSSE